MACFRKPYRRKQLEALALTSHNKYGRKVLDCVNFDGVANFPGKNESNLQPLVAARHGKP